MSSNFRIKKNIWVFILSLFLCGLCFVTAQAGEEKDAGIQVVAEPVPDIPDAVKNINAKVEPVEIVDDGTSQSGDASAGKPAATGMSISNSGGKKISNDMFSNRPEKMTSVRNLGKAEGVDTGPQAVSSAVQKIQSVELNQLEESRRDREARFNEKLNSREARKDFVKRRIARGIPVETQTAGIEDEKPDSEKPAAVVLSPEEKRKMRQERFSQFLKERDAQHPDQVDGIKMEADSEPSGD